MVGLSQIQGLDPETRATIAADEIARDAGDPVRVIELALLAALTDYRRAFARLAVAEGCDLMAVWRAMGKLPVRGRLSADLTAPLAP